MQKKPTALVLGGTFPHIKLIHKLQKRGFHTILVDYLDNPIAKHAADEHVQESTLDIQKVLEIARRLDAKLVISACIDQANLTACYVMEQLGFPPPYSYETALLVTNKVLMKQRMIENDIPTPLCVYLNDLKEIHNHEIRFPVIVKPADSNGSKGVRRADNDHDLLESLTDALNISRNKKAIVEEYIEGKELGVDCIVTDSQEVEIVMTRERQKIPATTDRIQQIFGSIWPADLTVKQVNELQRLAGKIAKVFNLKNTQLMIQAIIQNDEIYIIEIAPRVGGSENCRIIKMHTGLDVIDATIQSYLGIPIISDYRRPTSYFADNYLYMKPGIFGEIVGYEDLVRRGAIEYLNTYKTKGTEIAADMTSMNRVGVFTVQSECTSDLSNKIQTAIDSIEVHDIHGKPLMRRDIYHQQLAGQPYAH